MYTYKMTTHCLLSQACGEHPYRPAYLPNFATTTLTTSKCISDKKPLYTTLQSPGGKKKQPTFDHKKRRASASPHILFETKELPTHDLLLTGECKQGVARDAQERCCPS